jgi:hypothetical protein
MFAGGWLPEWDEPRKMAIIRRNKGHLNHRNRPDRAEKINKAMAGMPDRIAKMRKVRICLCLSDAETHEFVLTLQEIQDRKPKKDLDYLFKRMDRLTAHMHDGNRRRDE